MTNRKEKEIIGSYESQVKDIRIQLIDQLKCLDERKDQQTAIVSELQDYFRKRADVELDYAKNLDRLAKNLQQKQKSEKQKREQWHLCSLYSLYQTLVNVAKKQSRDHSVLGELYSNQICNRLAQSGDDLQRIYRRCREIGMSSHDELFRVHNELHTALKMYCVCLTEFRTSEKKYQIAKESEEKVKSGLAEDKQKSNRKLKSLIKETAKKQAKYEEARLRLLKARNEYLLCLNSANAALHKYFAEDLPELMDCMDFGLHRTVASALKVHQLAQEKMISKNKHYELEIRQCLDNFDSRADKQKFIEAHNSVFMLPKKFDFSAPIGDEVKEVLNEPLLQDELFQRFQGLTKRINDIRTENDEIWKTLDTTERTLIGMIDRVDCDVDALFSANGSTLQLEETANKRYPDVANKETLAGNQAPSTPTSAKVPETAVIKKKADKTETEQFYLLKFQEYTINSNLITRLQAKQKLLQHALGNEVLNGTGGIVTRHATMPPKTRRRRVAQLGSASQRPKLFGGSLEEYIEATRQDIPIVLKSCIRVIKQFGLHHQGIFRVSGSQVEINNFRDAFERGEDPLADVRDGRDINSIAGVFKLYLRELREPMFPLYMFDQLMEVSKIEDKEEFIKQIREQLLALPRPVFIVLRYLIAFLNHLSEYSDENMMDRFNLAICFGPTLLPIPESRDQVQFQQRVNVLIKNIFQYQDEIFTSTNLFGVLYEKYDVDIADMTETDILEATETFSEDDVEPVNPADDDTEMYEAMAVFDFTARTPAELTMRRGDILYLTEKIGNEWWRAQMASSSAVEGLVPDKYVEIRKRISQSDLYGVSNGSGDHLNNCATESIGSNASSAASHCGSGDDAFSTSNMASTLDLSHHTTLSRALTSGTESSKSEDDIDSRRWKLPTDRLIITEKTPREEMEERRHRALSSSKPASSEAFPVHTAQMPPSPRSQTLNRKEMIPKYYFGSGSPGLATTQRKPNNHFFPEKKKAARSVSVGGSEELVDAPDLVLNLPVKAGSPSYSTGTPNAGSDTSPEGTAAERFARSNQGTIKKSEHKPVSHSLTSPLKPPADRQPPSSPAKGGMERKEAAYMDPAASIDELLESLKAVASPSKSLETDTRPAVAPKPVYKGKPQIIAPKPSNPNSMERKAGAERVLREPLKPTSC